MQTPQLQVKEGADPLVVGQAAEQRGRAAKALSYNVGKTCIAAILMAEVLRGPACSQLAVDFPHLTSHSLESGGPTF